jgi:hypothetical protein
MEADETIVVDTTMATDCNHDGLYTIASTRSYAPLRIVINRESQPTL